jgi:hypothetical protein
MVVKNTTSSCRMKQHITIFGIIILVSYSQLTKFNSRRLLMIYIVDRALLRFGNSNLIEQLFDGGNDDGCQVLVRNDKYSFHYETLESILALYPLPQINSCNLQNTTFTFVIADGHEKEFYRIRSESWYEYAIQTMRNKQYNLVDGQVRYLGDVIRNFSSMSKDRKFHYTIQASCYCRTEEDSQWLSQHESHFCVLHEKCNSSMSMSSPSRVVGLNSKFENSFFPNILPKFNQSRSWDNVTHNLCVIGDVRRRQYKHLSEYFRKYPQSSGLQFHHFGLGSIQGPMKSFQQVITLHPNPNFTEYQYDLYQTCDAILSLLTKSRNSEYFDGPSKLSGGIVQAATYRIPILLHQDLAKLYKKYLHHVEVHDDKYDSFAQAFNRLLARLSLIKARIYVI